MEAFGKLVLGLLVGVISAIVRGFVLMKLWAWFVVGTFMNVPEINIVQGIGLIYVVSFFIIKERDFKVDEEVKDFEYYMLKTLQVIVFSLMMLFFGWIISLFM